MHTCFVSLLSLFTNDKLQWITERGRYEQSFGRSRHKMEMTDEVKVGNKIYNNWEHKY